MITDLTAEQARGARAMLKMTQGELAKRAGLTTKIIGRIEAKSGSLGGHSYDVVAPLLATFTAAGVVFLDGQGVRLEARP